MSQVEMEDRRYKVAYTLFNVELHSCLTLGHTKEELEKYVHEVLFTHFKPDFSNDIEVTLEESTPLSKGELS